nr:hypothetical protein [uncultured Carboxylicivirga sp.]
MGKKKNNNSKGNGNSFWERLLFKALEKFGLLGLISVAGVFIILKFPTDEQKHEFFNQYILFKNTTSATYQLIAITIFFGMIFVIERIYHQKEIETLNKKISRLNQKLQA